MIYLINKKEVKEIEETETQIIMEFSAIGWIVSTVPPQWYLASKGKLGRAF
tara:strand:- start:332 stop:484 length:153 start_codon:yes stop_codon:yes gene_type:complete